MTSIPWNRINTGLLLLVLLAVIGLFASRAYGGPLDPPGPPSPSDSVKLPGTPISSLPFVISQPGNYYVTRNLSMGAAGDGITIQASNVTVDLMGFELSPGPSLSAAFSEGAGSPARTGWVIRNGTVRDWPFNAIYAPSVASSVFEDLLIIASSGALSVPALRAGSDSTVHAVRFRTNPANGAIDLGENARVSDCLIETTAASVLTGLIAGPHSSITACTVIGYNSGIYAGANTAVSDCVLKGQFFAAVTVDVGSSVSGCTIEPVAGGRGILSINGSSTIARNTVRCVGGTTTAIETGGNDWVDGNSIFDCTYGIDGFYASNAVTRNRCRNATACIIDGAVDDIGPLGAASSATNPWSNIVD